MNTNNNCNKEDYSMDDLAAAMGSKLLEGGGTAKKRLIPNPQGQISGNIVETVLNYKLSHLNVPNCDKEATVIPTDSNNINIADDDDTINNTTTHTDIEYNEKECEITRERLQEARCSCGLDDMEQDKQDRRASFTNTRESCVLNPVELRRLQTEQRTIRKTLHLPEVQHIETKKNVFSKKLGSIRKGISKRLLPASKNSKLKLSLIKEEELGPYETADDWEDMSIPATLSSSMNAAQREALADQFSVQFQEGSAGDDVHASQAKLPPQDKSSLKSSSSASLIGSATVKVQFMTAKLRARLDEDDDGVLGVQRTSTLQRQMRNSLKGDKFMVYNMHQMNHEDERKEEEMDVEDVSYVRKPNLARIIEEYDALATHPKYSLKQVVLSRRFHLYANRFANAQYQRTLVYPTLRQPKELFSCPWLEHKMPICGECKEEEPVTEKQRTRTKGHRFIIAADTQFGILMDGFAMDCPSWASEIEISRKCVKQINAMHGDQRPLFVCVCGDLVDTESSFSGAIASWKKVMSGWERNLIFEQQVRDFKRVWSGLDADIALVCLCGNHDVGNKPTRQSINRWTSSFGDDFLSFWVNGTFNICLNNCLFSNPSGAQDLFEEQLKWMEEKLIYARENDATHIFVYGHFPWFLTHEEEEDDALTSYSHAPTGWGPTGSRFEDNYFTVPLKQRKIAMALFRKYDVTACFSGHFHQNVVTQTSWGMPMIVTGPLSMNLYSEIAEELSNGETNGLGMRVIDVGEKGKFSHKWILLDEEKECYVSAIRRCSRLRKSYMQSAVEEEDDEPKRTNSLFD